jgi:hypothetical protein
MRLIDVDKIGLTDFDIIMCNGDYKEALKMLLNKIDNAPTIAQPEIIHCQDCKYGEFPAHNVRCSEFYGAGCYNGFCAWAEKK